MEDSFWHPKVAILNALSIKKKDGLGYGKIQEYYALENNYFQMGEDLEIKLTCNFDFHKFPFDKNKCDFTYYSKVESYSTIILNPPKMVNYGQNKMSQITPGEKKTLLITKSISSEFKIWVEINQNSTLWDENSASGITFHFQRNSIGLLMGSFYAPTGLFAVLSMTSYVINPEVVSFDSTLI